MILRYKQLSLQGITTTTQWQGSPVWLIVPFAVFWSGALELVELKGFSPESFGRRGGGEEIRKRGLGVLAVNLDLTVIKNYENHEAYFLAFIDTGKQPA